MAEPQNSSASVMAGALGDASVDGSPSARTDERGGGAERPTKVIGPPSFSPATIVAGLRTLLQYPDLLYTLCLFRLNVRYKQSVLGWAWAVLQPLALMGIYTLIFAHVTTVKTGGIPYPIFVFSALLPWIFFSNSVSSAVHGLVTYPGLLTKMYFPREIIPLSYLAAGLADFFIAAAILAGLMVFYGVALTWNSLYAIPILVLFGGFASAIALFFSAVHVRFRDVGLAMPFVLQIWMFATPVVYSLQSVPLRFRKLYLLDPLAGLIETFRRAVIFGEKPDAVTLGWSAVTTIAALTIAYAYFKSSEATMADVI
jgi:lipopolysaccharide transport system permease protein